MYSAVMYVHTEENQARFNRALAQQLRAELSVCDLPNDKVAERLQIHRGTLYKYLRGETHIPSDMIFGVCSIIGLSPSKLMDRVIDRMEDLK